MDLHFTEDEPTADEREAPRGESPKLNWRPALWIVIAALLILMLGLTFLAAWTEWHPQKGDLAPATPQAVVQKKELAGLGWIDRVIAGRERLWSSIGKVVLLLKDLLVPATLAYLAYYLQQRERKREELVSEQAYLRETWNLMLSKSQANAEQHYLSVVSGITKVLAQFPDVWPDVCKDSDEQWQRRLWALLRLLRRTQHLARTIGGFFFQDREGEWLAGQCWNLFYKHSLRLGEADLDRALSAIQPNEDLSSLIDKLEGRPALTSSHQISQALNRLDTCLRGWVRTGELMQSLPLLKLLGATLRYEMNRTFEPWYGKKEDLEEDFPDALKYLEPGLELTKRARKYLERENARRYPP